MSDKPACLCCGKRMPVHRKAKRKACSRTCANMITAQARHRRRDATYMSKQRATNPSHG